MRRYKCLTRMFSNTKEQGRYFGWRYNTYYTSNKFTHLIHAHNKSIHMQAWCSRECVAKNYLVSLCLPTSPTSTSTHLLCCKDARVWSSICIVYVFSIYVFEIFILALLLSLGAEETSCVYQLCTRTTPFLMPILCTI
jgi:hypothetical protein